MKKSYPDKRKKGQLIVFGVLIFPVIFFCLAMVINVGMVVHDKINLQNSVDLAAIYAAQRQAEVMDAMAHINYQMRQSYKLFAWRYLILGSSGAFVEPSVFPGWHGFRPDKSHPNGGRWMMNLLNKPSVTPNRSLCPNADGISGATGCHNRECRTESSRAQCPYAVCTVHPLFHAQWYEDNTHICQSYMFHTSAYGLPPVTPQVGPLTTPSILRNDRIRKLRERLGNNCSDVGLQNWLIATSMYLSFFQEQQERKEFIEDVLFRRLVEGQDIENKPISDGVIHTIWKNLTYVNYRGFTSSDPPDPKLTFDIVQSQTGQAIPLSSGTSFDTFYEWDEVTPVPLYVQNTENQTGLLDDSHSTFCQTTVQSIFQCNSSGPLPELRSDPVVETSAMSKIAIYKPDYEPTPWCQILRDIFLNRSRDRVSGFFKKNSDLNLGVKVKVTIPYKGQLFFPFFTDSGLVPMTLTAVAYAKAFGASFGPSNPKEQDKLIPRILNHNPSESFMLFPNYSRFPGDLLGLTSERVQWAWNFLFTNGLSSGGDAIRVASESHGRTFNNYSDLVNNMDFYKDSMVLHHIPQHVSSTTTTVNLSADEIFTRRMRIYEEMAIAPDRFDLAYYTILPNYMLTLYPRLKNSLPNQYVPADLGHFRNSNATQIPLPDNPNNVYTSSPLFRGHNPEFRLNYIERQIIYARRQPNIHPFNSREIFSVFQQYKVDDVDKLLTSWAPEWQGPFAHSGDMYNNPPLGDCDFDDKDVRVTFGNSKSSDPFLDTGLERKMIPSHCLKGGRTGFSVKLIHPSAL